MENLINLINSSLEKYLKSIDNLQLRDVINYALFPGGKRLRPLILLSILQDLKLDLELGINPAIAIEMIHNYSLIHDDLPAMDNDDYRRGRFTVHKKFNEALAILAGDALLTDAFYLLSNSKLPLDTKIEIIQLTSKNSGSKGMILGQVLDISAVGKDLERDEIEEIHLHKTKDLIQIAIKTAGIIASFNQDELMKLDELAYFFGLAFQIKDDIDDFKESSSDLLNKKPTYPIIIGLEESISLLEEYKTKSLDICSNIIGDGLFYKLIEAIL